MLKAVVRLFALFILVSAVAGRAKAQQTAFIFSGSLSAGGSAAQGFYDLQFTLFDASTNGNQVGLPMVATNTAVSNGLFSVSLDFGPLFTGSNYWLQIAAQTNGGSSFTTLSPLEPITYVPNSVYAMITSNLLGTVASGQVTGALVDAQLPVNVVTNGATNLILSGTFSGSGVGLTGVLSSNVVGATTVVSIVRIPYMTAMETNDEAYPMDQSSTNFELTGDLLSTNPTGPSLSFWVPAAVQTGAQGPAFENANAVGVTFGMDGSQFILNLTDAGQTWSMEVNGVDNFLVTTVPTDGRQRLYQVTFATAATRTITLNNPWPFAGVYLPITNGFYSDQGSNLSRLVVLGDNFIEQNYTADAPSEGIASQMKLLLPNLDIWALGESGTGFVNGGTNGGTNFLGRVADVVAADPAYLVIYGGINDVSWTTNTSPTNEVYVAATNLIASLQAHLPLTQIAVIGPEWPRTPSPVSDANVFNCSILLSNACLAAAVPYVSPVQEPWITGNALVAGSGNADTYTLEPDGANPTIPAGARYYANQIVTALGQYWNFGNPSSSTPAGALVLSATNTMPIPAPGEGFLWNSNNALYWITTAHTNLISGP